MKTSQLKSFDVKIMLQTAKEELLPEQLDYLVQRPTKQPLEVQRFLGQMLQYPKLIHSGPKPTKLYLEHKEHLPLEQTRPHQEGFSEQSLKLPLAKQHQHQDLRSVKILQHQVLLAVSLDKINLLVPQ